MTFSTPSIPYICLSSGVQVDGNFSFHSVKDGTTASLRVIKKENPGKHYAVMIKYFGHVQDERPAWGVSRPNWGVYLSNSNGTYNSSSHGYNGSRSFLFETRGGGDALLIEEGDERAIGNKWLDMSTREHIVLNETEAHQKAASSAITVDNYALSHLFFEPSPFPGASLSAGVAGDGRFSFYCPRNESSTTLNVTKKETSALTYTVAINLLELNFDQLEWGVELRNTSHGVNCYSTQVYEKSAQLSFEPIGAAVLRIDATEKDIASVQQCLTPLVPFGERRFAEGPPSPDFLRRLLAAPSPSPYPVVGRFSQRWVEMSAHPHLISLSELSGSATRLPAPDDERIQSLIEKGRNFIPADGKVVRKIFLHNAVGVILYARDEDLKKDIYFAKSGTEDFIKCESKMEEQARRPALDSIWTVKVPGEAEPICFQFRMGTSLADGHSTTAWGDTPLLEIIL